MPMTCLMLCPLQAIQKVKWMVDVSGILKVWKEWEIRILVVLSLFLQVFLIFFAPLRRRKTAKWVRPFIWAFYLLADWVASFTLGILSNNHCTNSSSPNELVAFWAPFLLVHLGGPDTITALALEDNQLWLRHFLALAVHVTGVVYVFVFTLPQNRLLIPTFIIFIVGIVRYMERSLALYLASSGGFRWSMRTEDDKLNSLLTLKGMAKEPEEAIGGADGLPRISGIEAVQLAHRFLATYKSLVVDHLLSFQEGKESRSFFLRLHPDDAFGIIEVELELLFDMLYTKATVIHSRAGYISRVVCFSFILAALAIFIAFDKRGHHPADKYVTYILLLGAMVVDIVAIWNLIFSNWMVATLRNPTARSLVSKMFTQIRPSGTPRHPAYMSQYNLISYCLRHCWKSRMMTELLRVKDFMEQLGYTKDVRVSTELRKFIFEDLRTKSIRTTSLDVIRHMSESRWEWAENMPIWFFKLELEESILLWHIATDLCYHLREYTSPDRDCSKLVSNYMHYLLVMHPTMISSKEGTAQIKWQAVCQETMRFIRKRHLKDEKDICQKLSDEITFYSTTQRTGSLLRDACLVAKELLRQQPNMAWTTIRKVWVELLSYAANRCSGRDHVHRLVKGGDFIAYVWLLKAHFGLAEQYWGELNFPKVDSSMDDVRGMD